MKLHLRKILFGNKNPAEKYISPPVKGFRRRLLTGHYSTLPHLAEIAIIQSVFAMV